MEWIHKNMVKMKRCIAILIFFYSIGNLVMCRRHSCVYTYYCKGIDYTFSVLEKDTCNVIVFGKGDSVFYASPLYGDYLGIEFYLSVDSNIVYLGPHFPVIYNIVENNYKIMSTKIDINRGKHYVPYRNSAYWGFYGGCDQGSYTFAVFHNSQFIEGLEPLEWK